MQSVEPSKLKEKISQCNLVNSGIRMELEKILRI
jgi:hypothetical protein